MAYITKPNANGIKSVLKGEYKANVRQLPRSARVVILGDRDAAMAAASALNAFDFCNANGAPLGRHDISSLDGRHEMFVYRLVA